MNQDPRDSNQPMTDEPKPVAYDSEGRPLYSAPPTTDAASPKSVYFSRAVSPAKQQVSDDVKARHDDSVKRFPALNLSEAEYVISAVERHPIGLVGPVAVTVLLVALIASFLINFSLIVSSLGIVSTPPFGAVLLVGMLLILLVLVGGYIAIWIYTSNHFFLTNESVIQEIQTSLFTRHEQTVSLINIEDASYEQRGILQAMLNYGSIRLSTEGDETTYRFSYVSNPKEQIATLNNAVEAFKNGRPVLND
jgi:uncharacterized membrane protein YdbT with pleckstrin-like domain